MTPETVRSNKGHLVHVASFETNRFGPASYDTACGKQLSVLWTRSVRKPPTCDGCRKVLHLTDSETRVETRREGEMEDAVRYPRITTGWTSPEDLARYEYENEPLTVIPFHDEDHPLNITIEVPEEPTPDRTRRIPRCEGRDATLGLHHWRFTDKGEGDEGVECEFCGLVGMITLSPRTPPDSENDQ